MTSLDIYECICRASGKGNVIIIPSFFAGEFDYIDSRGETKPCYIGSQNAVGDLFINGQLRDKWKKAILHNNNIKMLNGNIEEIISDLKLSRQKALFNELKDCAKGYVYVPDPSDSQDLSKKCIWLAQELFRCSIDENYANGKKAEFLMQQAKADDNFDAISAEPKYREFLTNVLLKYYGSGFLAQINDRFPPALAYTIEGIPHSAKRSITELDALICPEDGLDLCNEVFDASKTEPDTDNALYERYHALMEGRIKYPKRPGYMLDEIRLEGDRVKSISAHIGTYDQTAYSCHILEYELYLAYREFGDQDLNDPAIWGRVYKSLALRNRVHGSVGHCGDPDFSTRMKESLLQGANRSALIGVQMLVLVKKPGTDQYKVLIGQRSANNVAMAPGLYEIPPAGGFEVLSDSSDNLYDPDELLSCYSPGSAVFREFLEELFSVPEYEGSARGNVGAMRSRKEIRSIENMIKDGTAVFQFLGCSIDLLLLRPNLDFALVIEDEGYTEISDCFVANDEYKKGKLLMNVTADNFEDEKQRYIWTSHHGPSAGLWDLFKKSDLYKKVLTK